MAADKTFEAYESIAGESLARVTTLEVVLPFDLVKRSKVHKDLSIDSKVKQLADIGLNERRCFVFGEVIWFEHCVTVFFVGGL